MAKKKALTQQERIESLESQVLKLKEGLLALYRGQIVEFKKIFKLNS